MNTVRRQQKTAFLLVFFVSSRRRRLLPFFGFVVVVETAGTSALRPIRVLLLTVYRASLQLYHATRLLWRRCCLGCYGVQGVHTVHFLEAPFTLEALYIKTKSLTGYTTTGFRAAVPSWRRSTQIPSSLSPKRD